ncbi:MAG: hypothetical protein HY823_06215 [Acidobacteria bacterium]|nr:hypothetical protein [Acidobacteriota bacterium]
MRLPALLLAPCLFAAAAQKPDPPRVLVPRLSQAPSRAADADLSSWQGALVVEQFGMVMPDDKGQNRWPTKVLFAFGPDAFYAAAECRDPEPEQVRAWRHKRDSFGDMDFLGIDLDPSGKGQSCIRLIVSPLGGHFDGLVTDADGENYNYDLLWNSAGVLTEWGYVVKFRVPYSSLRRLPGDWGLRVLRILPRERRYGIAWPPQSRDVPCDVCQMARASGAPVDKPGSPFLVIPFATARREESREPGASPGAHDTTRLGLDLRYSSTSLTVDGTYRPDFSNVEADVDPLQINSRFKVFYPEKRPFFLEGMDLLGIQGAQRQFYSRTIGDPLYGVKVSGQDSWASWSALHARDREGGTALTADGALGTEGRATRDSAAVVRFRLDGRGSGISVLGTDKTLEGAQGAGGRSAGLYWNQWLGPAFQFIGSRVETRARLPQGQDPDRVRQGSATSLEVNFNQRNWTGWLATQDSSPELVLASGFATLTGYHQENAGLVWRERWNAGRLAQARVQFRAYRYTWWDRSPMEQAGGFEAYLETAGRWALQIGLDPAGRAWAQGRDMAIRNRRLNLSWLRHAEAQVFVNAAWNRVPDLATGDPARLRSLTLGSEGNVSAFLYAVSARTGELEGEANGRRLVRARQLTGTAGYQFPLAIYARVQAFVVRYDGRDPASVDKYLKLLAGWQPNAFTHAYLGWSGRRRRDPGLGLESERLAERGIFAKFAYALQF